MKIVVIGGTGLIGSKLVQRLRAHGHTVLPASPGTGVNALTGEGLAAALASAEIVVDVSNSPSFADADVLAFFQTSTRNLLDAEAAAGVRHHVALSVVGADRLPDAGYLRAKVVQEALIAASPIPYTILRATQFFEFVGAITNTSVVEGVIRLPPAQLQPIAADDVVEKLTELTLAAPLQGIVEIGGPERIALDELARGWLRAKADPREVVTDAAAGYFGTALDDASLTAAAGATLGHARYEDWLRSLPA